VLPKGNQATKLHLSDFWQWFTVLQCHFVTWRNFYRHKVYKVPNWEFAGSANLLSSVKFAPTNLCCCYVTKICVFEYKIGFKSTYIGGIPLFSQVVRMGEFNTNPYQTDQC